MCFDDLECAADLSRVVIFLLGDGGDASHGEASSVIRGA